MKRLLAKRAEALDILTHLIARYAEERAQAYESVGRHAEAKEIRRSTAEGLHRADECGARVKAALRLEDDPKGAARRRAGLVGPVWPIDPDQLPDDGEDSRDRMGAPRRLDDDQDDDEVLDTEPGFRPRGRRAAGRLDGDRIYQRRKKRRPRLM